MRSQRATSSSDVNCSVIAFANIPFTSIQPSSYVTLQFDFDLLQSPNKPTVPQEKIRPLTSLDHPQSPFYDAEGRAINPLARVVVERIARKVRKMVA